MLSTYEKVATYTDSLERWLKANKEHPGIYHGPEPMPEEHHLLTEQEKWLAEKTRDRIKREFARMA